MIERVTSLKAPSVAIRVPDDLNSNESAKQQFLNDLGEVGIRDVDVMSGDEWSITHLGFHTVSGDYSVAFPSEYIVRLGESDEFHVFSEDRFFELFTLRDQTAGCDCQ